MDDSLPTVVDRTSNSSKYCTRFRTTRTIRVYCETLLHLSGCPSEAPRRRIVVDLVHRGLQYPTKQQRKVNEKRSCLMAHYTANCCYCYSDTDRCGHRCGPPKTENSDPAISRDLLRALSHTQHHTIINIQGNLHPGPTLITILVLAVLPFSHRAPQRPTNDGTHNGRMTQPPTFPAC